MRVIGAFLLAGVALAQAPAYKEIANTGQLMQGMIQPASSAIAEASKDAGPADQRAWRTVMLHSLMLQETGQLLLMGSRAKDQDGWVKATQALMDAGAAAQKAAQAKDVAALQAASASINSSCQGCHSVYRQRGGGRKQEPPK
jgi:cytochrome c556